MWMFPATARTNPTGAPTAPEEKAKPKTEDELMSQTKTIGRSTGDADTYFALVKRHRLTSIRSEKDLDAAQSVVDALLRENLDDGGQAYLDALSDLIIVYEQEHHAIAPLPPHELLAHMLQERRMSQADLMRVTGLAKATISDLVTGRRPFTVKQMQAVANLFGLPGAVFMPKSIRDVVDE
jgi:HTH-type transcriptional regulator/antitoxin HigA